MNIGPNGYKTKKFGFVVVTIRVQFLKKCWVFDLTLAQSNIEHPLYLSCLIDLSLSRGNIEQFFKFLKNIDKAQRLFGPRMCKQLHCYFSKV